MVMATAAGRLLLTPARPYVRDRFLRENNASSLGTAETRQAWQSLASSWGTIDGAAYNAGGAATSFAAVDAKVSDCRIRMRVTRAGGSVGMCFRMQDASNGWYFLANGAAGVLNLRQAAADTNKGSLTLLLTGPRTYDVVLNGPVISIYEDGLLKLTVSDATFQTNTLHGLYNGTTVGNRYRDFQVGR